MSRKLFVVFIIYNRHNLLSRGKETGTYAFLAFTAFFKAFYTYAVPFKGPFKPLLVGSKDEDYLAAVRHKAHLFENCCIDDGDLRVFFYCTASLYRLVDHPWMGYRIEERKLLRRGKDYGTELLSVDSAGGDDIVSEGLPDLFDILLKSLVPDSVFIDDDETLIQKGSNSCPCRCSFFL